MQVKFEIWITEIVPDNTLDKDIYEHEEILKMRINEMLKEAGAIAYVKVNSHSERWNGNGQSSNMASNQVRPE
jgi:hypothetical protein